MPAPVDPRDTRWEVDTPIYRVYFWHRPAAEPGSDQERMGWHCSEWRLTDAADVHEVLAWANGPDGRGRVFELYVEASHSDGLALLRLAGTTSDAARRQRPPPATPGRARTWVRQDSHSERGRTHVVDSLLTWGNRWSGAADCSILRTCVRVVVRRRGSA